MKSALIIVFTTLIMYAVLKLALGPLSEKVKISSSIIAPFGTVIEHYCTPAGVEYFVTDRGYMVLHVSPSGEPVICASFQPLAED
jgi:hypothetical protein